MAAILSVSDRLIASRLTEICQSFCPKVDFVYLLTIRLKLEIVLTREITTKDFFFSSVAVGPAYFLNGPNAAASTAPTLIRHAAYRAYHSTETAIAAVINARVLGLSYVVVFVILGLAIFVELRLVTDR